MSEEWRRDYQHDNPDGPCACGAWHDGTAIPDLGKRCEVRSKDGWRCTKWAGHRLEEHTALAPSGWHPDYAIRLDGTPNIPVGPTMSAWEASRNR